jgi:hypothetical protein
MHPLLFDRHFQIWKKLKLKIYKYKISKLVKK